MNIVALVGRVTRDPDIRQSQGENPMVVARYTLAVDRRGTKEKDKADFISMVSFGKTAEFIEKYVKKGTKLCIRGRIQTGSYEKDGKKIYTTDVVAEDIEFAESKKQSQETQEQPQEKPVDDFIAVVDGELPFA